MQVCRRVLEEAREEFATAMNPKRTEAEKKMAAASGSKAAKVSSWVLLMFRWLWVSLADMKTATSRRDAV